MPGSRVRNNVLEVGPVVNDSPERVEVLEGQDARAILRDQRFLREWAALCRVCPWATLFQGPKFINAWYDVYVREYTPLLLCGWRGDSLCGLITLAQRVSDGTPVVAGTYHAEYQVWLCTAEDLPWFLTRAIALFQKRCPNRELSFRYVPEELPVDCLRAAGFFITSTVQKRPLMRIDPEEIRRSLSKKSNKSRLNRLKRVGPVVMERITDVGRFEKVIDDIIWQYDLRQGAVNRSTPFLEDPGKRRFHLALMAHPGMLHVTVMRVGEQLVSAHVDFMDGVSSYLGIPTHSPYFFQHSPGKLHMLLLGQQLADDGVSCLDLTPGGDPWKERFANDHTNALELTIHASRTARFIDTLPDRLRSGAKRVIGKTGLDPAAVKSVLTHVPIIGSRFADVQPDRLHPSGTGQLYRVTGAAEAGSNDAVAINNPRDLLRRMPNEDLAAKHRLLSGALARLEAGHTLYTVVDEKHLLGLGWLAPDLEAVGLGERAGTGVLNRRVAHGIAARGPKEMSVRETILRAMLSDAGDGATPVVLVLDADDPWLSRGSFGFELLTEVDSGSPSADAGPGGG